jgi:hypothetical protein
MDFLRIVVTSMHVKYDITDHNYFGVPNELQKAMKMPAIYVYFVHMSIKKVVFFSLFVTPFSHKNRSHQT